MASDLTEPHCRFCAATAVVRQEDGSWVCAKHENYTPWGAAVLMTYSPLPNTADEKKREN
jgi:ribosomal protein L37AE/L43A